MNCEKLKSLLSLVPLPFEGGCYAETYRSSDMIAPECLRGSYSGPRSVSTAIYYLLEPNTFSELHRVASDEIFHFYLGDPVEMLLLFPDGRSDVVTLGPDLAGGQRPQILVPAGVWQGQRLMEGGKVALFGCTVTPGFDFADYCGGSYAELAAKWPTDSERIRKLTRK